MSLEVKSEIKKSDKIIETDIVNNIDELLVGLPPDVVFNILASYLAHSLINLHDRNKSKIFKTLETFKNGCYKIALENLKDLKPN